MVNWNWVQVEDKALEDQGAACIYHYGDNDNWYFGNIGNLEKNKNDRLIEAISHVNQSIFTETFRKSLAYGPPVDCAEN